MRIAVVVDTFPTVSETFVVNQIIGFIESGHDVQIFAFYKGPEQKIHDSINQFGLLDRVTYPRNFTKQKYKSALKFFYFLLINCFSLNYLLLLELLFKLAFNSSRLERIEFLQWFIFNKPFDLVHAHFGPIGQRMSSLKRYKSLKKTRLFNSFHGYDLSPCQLDYNKIRYGELFKYADGFIVNTPYLKSILKEVKGNLNNVHEIPVGLDTNFFRPAKLERRPDSILFCGRLIKLKAPDLAIKIAYELTKKGIEIHLSIAGTGEMENELRNLVRLLNITKNVSFLGEVSQEEVKVLMNTHQVFLFPGRHDPITGRAETQGLVIQEAQAMQLPVLVSDAGGMKYGLIDGETGFVIRENDISSFVEKILFLFNSPNHLKIMGVAGRSFVKKYYSFDLITKKHLEVFKN